MARSRSPSVAVSSISPRPADPSGCGAAGADQNGGPDVLCISCRSSRECTHRTVEGRLMSAADARRPSHVMFIWADGMPTPDELAGLQRDLPSWVQDVDRRGVRLFGRELDLPETAATVRVRRGGAP